ncbi:hypothetical protein WMY93_002005 [Mugilogobius chulae]|uniref:Integrin alpha-2 domain-containing protein n=1 Tax=Mugilogobius chulae TaxID=88201 RepID=A0AAW0PV38_9GOBI
MAPWTALRALLLLHLHWFQHCGSFNLDVDKPSVFSGPPGSYFGFSVDFFKPSNSKSDVLIGAPRANRSGDSSVVERGAVYSCPWSASPPANSSPSTAQACAPLYQWSTFGISDREPVGTCFLKKEGKVVEYSPCRSSQLISDDISEIYARTTNNYINQYSNTMATRSAGAQYDDSYLGYSVTVGDFNDDGQDDYVTGVPRGDKALGYVNIFNGQNMESVVNFTGTQMAAYFGHSVAATDINRDGLMDLFIGAPLFMDRGSDGKLREVGQVSVYLGRGGFSFQAPQLLTGSEVYARYGSSIAALGDLDMDGFNDVAISAPYGGPDHAGLVYIHNGRSRGPTPHPHRARPVISVNATMDLTPQIINPEDKTCVIPGTSTSVSCFKVKYCLKARGIGAPPALTFKVDITLDRLKQKETTKRVLFLHNKSSQYSRNLGVTNNEKLPLSCEELDIFLRGQDHSHLLTMEYSLDYLSAADSTGLLPIVDMSAPSNITKQAHILLDCGDDNICKPDLKLSVKSPQQIYIGDDNALTLEVSAENQGEGAYEAELHVFPPQQADFTGVVRSQTLTRLSCAYKKENNTKMVVCDLGNPMKGGTKVLAELRFSVHQLSDEDTSVKFELQVVSSNQFNNTSPRVSSTTKLAVLAKVAIEGKNAIKDPILSSNPGQVLLPIANWKPRERPVVGDDIGPQIVLVYELLNSGPSTFSKASLDVEVPFHFRNGSVLYVTSFDTEGPINCTTDTEINPLNVSNPLTPEKNVTGGIPPRERETEGRNRHNVRKRDLESRDAQGDIQTLDCTTSECLFLRCQVGRLERGKNAILFVYSRLDVNNFLRVENQNRSYVIQSKASFSVIEIPYKKLEFDLPSNSTSVSVSVLWVADSSQPVPGWVVALAVLAGLLLLALLIFIMYKLGFFNRVRPPQDDCAEKEQLQPEENGNMDG